MRRKTNKGLTLVELIIVLGISAILLAMVGLSYSLINNTNVQKSARRLENVIRLARTRSMAKGPAAGKLVLYEQNGNIYARIGDDPSPELICNSGVTMEAIATSTVTASPTPGASSVNYTAKTGGAAIPPLGGTAEVHIVFNAAGTIPAYSNSYNKFLLHRGNRNFEVIVYRETGAVETNMY